MNRTLWRLGKSKWTKHPSYTQPCDVGSWVTSTSLQPTVRRCSFTPANSLLVARSLWVPSRHFHSPLRHTLVAFQSHMSFAVMLSLKVDPNRRRILFSTFTAIFLQYSVYFHVSQVSAVIVWVGLNSLCKTTSFWFSCDREWFVSCSW